MKANRITTTCMLIYASFGVCLPALGQGQTPLSNPYLAIVSRNMFGLRPPPIPIIKTEPKPLPEFILQGIIANLMPKSAILKIKQPAGPGAPASEESFILQVGQRQGDLQVLAIKETQGLVTVSFGETILELTFQRNGVKQKAPALAGAAAAPVYPPVRLPTLAAPETFLTPEEQTILIEAEREKNRHNPDYAPLPPTSLTSPADLKSLMAPHSRR
jgi:hypothetical protein